MTLHDFTELFSHYPELIDTMPPVFTSHQFILQLAQAHQVAYVTALAAYRNTLRSGTPAPFNNVHRELAQGLRNFPERVEYLGDVPSKDIFGQANSASQWRKI